MGVLIQIAANVSIGPNGDIPSFENYFRSSPNSGHSKRKQRLPACAICGHSLCTVSPCRGSELVASIFAAVGIASFFSRAWSLGTKSQ
jgi:hypothetical protein